MTKNQIIEQLFTGKNFLDCISKMEPDHLREDLRQEVILIICEQPEEKILKLHADKALEFFTVRVILNQIKSSTSPFAKKYRQSHPEYNESHGTHVNNNKHGVDYTVTEKKQWLKINEPVFEEIEIEERQLREMIEDMAIEEIDRLHWYNKGLIELYVKHGNFRAIEKETGIPFGSCFKTIKKSFEQIKSKVKCA